MTALVRRVPLLLALALSIAFPASVLAARAWQLAVSPSTISVDTQTNIRLTVTNTGDSGGGSEITCVRVQVPASFVISDARVLSVHGQTSGTAFNAWIPVWFGGNVVTFKEPADQHPLVGSSPPLDEAVFQITGAASSSGSMTWTVLASDKPAKTTTTDCGAGSSPAKSPTISVGAAATPTPAPTPTPTPRPTPTPTPRPTPTPTPRPTATPAPTPTPALGGAPSAPPGPGPSAKPGPTAAPLASPAPSSSQLPGTSPSPLPSATPGVGSTPAPTSVSAPTLEPTNGDPGGGGGAPGQGAFLTPGAGANGNGRPSTDGLDGAALSVLQKLPGGLIAFAGPAVALSVPGLLVLIAVGAQALGGLAWLPVARRKLGGFGLRRPRQ